MVLGDKAVDLGPHTPPLPWLSQPVNSTRGPAEPIPQANRLVNQAFCLWKWGVWLVFFEEPTWSRTPPPMPPPHGGLNPLTQPVAPPPQVHCLVSLSACTAGIFFGFLSKKQPVFYKRKSFCVLVWNDGEKKGGRSKTIGNLWGAMGTKMYPNQQLLS